MGRGEDEAAFVMKVCDVYKCDINVYKVYLASWLCAEVI